ncbi:MAG: hypothetical protein LVS60_09250 [Nodosilinea sp. LVE1205-7]|jgi:5'(3')-deoxyribonucleotidase
MDLKILYIDMDNVLVDFLSGIARISPEVVDEYEDRCHNVPGIYSLMEPLPGAVESFELLAGLYDTYILSTAPWENPSAWSDKLLWVKRYLGPAAHKRLILSHHKNLNERLFEKGCPRYISPPRGRQNTEFCDNCLTP